MTNMEYSAKRLEELGASKEVVDFAKDCKKNGYEDNFNLPITDRSECEDVNYFKLLKDGC